MNLYFNDISILGLGFSVFDRLGIESFIKDYKILVLNDSDWVNYFPELKNLTYDIVNILPNYSISDKKNPTVALNELDWHKIKKELKVQNLLTYKPVEYQKKFQDKNDIIVLNNSFDLFSLFENKVRLRKMLDEDFFSKYKILSFSDLYKTRYEDLFDIFSKFVIQDSKLSGGKGTFIVSNEEDYQIALQYLFKIKSEEIVVSKYASGIDASIQACITKNGVFMLPLQRQIISESVLIDTSMPGADTFNGGQWSRDDFTSKENDLAKKYVLSVANKMKELGYKGMFGVDLIVSESQVYLIEVNARLTGMTAIIAEIQNSLGQIPLILLHVLEHMNADYHLEDEDIDNLFNYSFKSSDYGYLILFNNTSQNIEMKNTIKPGVYSIENKKLRFKKLEYTVSALNDKNHFLLIDFPNEGSLLKPNERIGRLIFKKKIIDSEGNLIKEVKNIVALLRRAISD